MVTRHPWHISRRVAMTRRRIRSRGIAPASEAGYKYQYTTAVSTDVDEATLRQRGRRTSCNGRSGRQAGRRRKPQREPLRWLADWQVERFDQARGTSARTESTLTGNVFRAVRVVTKVATPMRPLPSGRGGPGAGTCVGGAPFRLILEKGPRSLFRALPHVGQFRRLRGAASAARPLNLRPLNPRPRMRALRIRALRIRALRIRGLATGSARYRRRRRAPPAGHCSPPARYSPSARRRR